MHPRTYEVSTAVRGPSTVRRSSLLDERVVSVGSRWRAACFESVQGDTMKKQGSRKLALNRETLQSLESAKLEGVGGGATPSLLISAGVAITLFFCFPREAR